MYQKLQPEFIFKSNPIYDLIGSHEHSLEYPNQSTSEGLIIYIYI